MDANEIVRRREGAVFFGIIAGLALTLLHIITGGYPLAAIKGFDGLLADEVNPALTVIAVGVVLISGIGLAKGIKSLLLAFAL